MFIVLPVGMNYETKRLPLVTFSLMGINTLVYVVSLICTLSYGEGAEEWIMQNLWLIPGTSSVIAYLTSMFVHAGFFHLLGNMIFLFLFGCRAEDMIGRVRFALLYLVCGFVAEMVFIASTPQHFSSLTPMGGASGAISGCMGMYLLLRASSKIEFKYFYFFFLFGAGGGDFMLAAWIAITFWFLNDVLGMLIDMQTHHRGGGTAFGAHVGGLLAGMAFVGLYRLVAQKKEMAEEEAEELQEMPGASFQPAMARVQTTPVQAQPAARIRIRATPALQASPVETPTIFLHENGQQTGPFTLTTVQEMLRQGSLTPEAVYWSEGMADWQSVTELAG